MTDSILNSVKEDIGIDPSDDSFDNQIIRAINTSFMFLYQIGFGYHEYKVTDANDSWETIASEVNDPNGIDEVKTYLSNRVHQIFDPAGITSSMNNAINEQNRELEWRINAKYDRTRYDEDEEEKT